MSCMISIHQHNRGIFIEARNYQEQNLEGMYLKINVGKDEIVLHCNRKQDAENMAKDILAALEKLEDRDVPLALEEMGKPCQPT